jgi:hypothetical protein
MKPLVIEAEKMLGQFELATYRIDLRVMSYELPHGKPVYELAVWNKWTLMDKTNWSSWDDALREFEHAKRKIAVTLAEAVLFNQAKPEDQDDE